MTPTPADAQRFRRWASAGYRKSNLMPPHRYLPLCLALLLSHAAHADAPAPGSVGELVRHGVYQYRPWINEAHGGAEQQRLQQHDAGPIPFATGALTSDSPAKVGWRGGASEPKTVAVVFDLLADRSLSRVELLAAAPNKFWRVREVELDYRPAGSGVYHVGGQQVWEDGKPVVFDLGGAQARYVRIRLSRVHEYIHIPLDHVRIFVAPGSDAETTAASFPGAGAGAEGLDAEFDRDTLLVDAYGQAVFEDWPGKVRSDDDLRRDAEQEASWLEANMPDRSHLDAYGGDRRYPREQPTGFFRLAKIDDRWWFVTPEGHRFFVIGADGAGWHEWGYATPLQKPDGSPRGVFESLPDHQRFAQAYKHIDGKTSLSFVVANLMRKYGDDFAATWSDVTTRRLHAWGFNTHAKWTRDPNVKLPYITVLRPRGERRILWGIDPFDPGYEAALEAGMRDRLIALRDDPWIVGHTFENERGWDRKVVNAMLELTDDSPAKRAFLAFLRDEAGLPPEEIASSLSAPDASFDELHAMPLTATEDLDPHIDRFVERASARYHEAVRRVMKRHDPNHAFLGCSLVPTWRSSPAWVAGSVPHVDALSFDNYRGDPSWIEPYLAYDKPILLLEFSFSTPGRGLRAHSSASAAPDERSRGLKYRHLTEQLAATPQFVGFGWFLFYDQPVTRRDLPGGESFNMGLVNQADQPYDAMIAEMMRTNARLYPIHAGAIQPYAPHPD